MSLDRILCLANSYKHDNRCVAGIHLATKKWVRLVGQEVPGCLTMKEACFPDGKEVTILDVFEAELGQECGSNFHPEDVFVAKKPWQPVRRFDSPRDAQFLKAFVNTEPVVLDGYCDRVYARRFDKARARRSLGLVQPDDLWWWIRIERGKRKNRALFRLGHVGHVRYDLPVTDPAMLNALIHLPVGIHSNSLLFGDKPMNTLLTVSLSEPFDGFLYKLVAGVVNLPA